MLLLRNKILYPGDTVTSEFIIKHVFLYKNTYGMHAVDACININSDNSKLICNVGNIF